MDSHIKSDIEAFLAGQLAESRRRDVQAHIRACDPCRRAMDKQRNRRAHQNREALKRASASVPEMLRSALPGGAPGRSGRSLGFWIIAVSVLIAAGWWWKSRPAAPPSLTVERTAAEQAPEEVAKPVAPRRESRPRPTVTTSPAPVSPLPDSGSSMSPATPIPAPVAPVAPTVPLAPPAPATSDQR